MIERKRANFILNEAKNAGDTGVSARLFNEVQDEICLLQPIDGILNKLLAVEGRSIFFLLDLILRLQWLVILFLTGLTIRISPNFAAA